MGRKALWVGITDALEADIQNGHYGPGKKLPTEATLATRFGVNRHTVRRAIAELGERGLVFSRRGAGVFVTQTQTEYPIGSRVRFHQNVLDAGRTPERTFLLLETRSSDSVEADTLGINTGDIVHVCEGLSLVDGEPLALFRSVFPADRFPNLLSSLGKNGSVTEALKAGGVADYTRRETRIDGKLATVTMATQLHVSAGSPLLRTTSVNVDENGVPVEYGRTWFVAERTTLLLSTELSAQVG